jgi:hypothetical protein
MRTDADFLAAFASCTLPRPEWTHEAHVRMAYLYLRDRPDADALLPAVREGIHRLNASYGNPTGYHETITAAFLRLVADRLRRAPSPTFDAFRAAHPDLFLPALGGLAPHYTHDLLHSTDARARFLPPDRDPLP